MSLGHYFLWGYLILFGLVAFFVYAACVMAGRADQVETARRSRKRPVKAIPTLTSSEITPMPTQPEPTTALTINLERERVNG